MCLPEVLSHCFRAALGCGSSVQAHEEAGQEGIPDGHKNTNGGVAVCQCLTACLGFQAPGSTDPSIVHSMNSSSDSCPSRAGCRPRRDTNSEVMPLPPAAQGCALVCWRRKYTATDRAATCDSLETLASSACKEHWLALNACTTIGCYAASQWPPL